MRWKIVGLVLFAFLIAAFTLMNSTIVPVNFFFYHLEVNLVLVILLSLLLGMGLMALLWSIQAWQWRGGRIKFRQELQTLKEQQPDDEESMSGSDGELMRPKAEENSNTSERPEGEGVAEEGPDPEKKAGADSSAPGRGGA